MQIDPLDHVSKDKMFMCIFIKEGIMFRPVSLGRSHRPSNGYWNKKFNGAPKEITDHNLMDRSLLVLFSYRLFESSFQCCVYGSLKHYCNLFFVSQNS